MTIFQAKLERTSGSSAPDEYDPSKGLIPPDDFVVSRDADGNPLSYYGQISWDRSAYGTGGSDAVLYFDYWRPRYASVNLSSALRELTPQRAMLVSEIRWIIFVMIYLRPHPTSSGTLNNYCSTLCELANVAESKNTTLQQFLADSNPLLGFAESRPSRARPVAAILQFLRQLGPDHVGFGTVSIGTINTIRRIARTHADNMLQTPPLPTRIYTHVLASLSKEIVSYEKVIDQLLQILEACVRDPLLGREESHQRKRARQKIAVRERGDPYRPEFLELIRQQGLEEFWSSKAYGAHFKSLYSVLTEIMAACALQIQAFTGMRHTEVRNLPHFCLEEVTAAGTLHYIVKGRVTKLTGGKIKRVQWVTSESGRRAILLAQRISQAVYKLAGDLPRNTTERINSHHLFVSLTYVTAGNQAPKNAPPTIHLGSTASLDRLRSVLEIQISEEDLQELELVDPERNWRAEENFQPGKPWSLASHQLRRSLALYAHASGLVSLPSLKQQLQHITREMSLYYARGSQFTKDFIVRENDDEKHFGEEWLESEPEAAYLGHLLNVELGDPGELAGAYSLWYDRNVRRKQISLDRATTLKEFRQGKRAYRETFAGGCAKVGPCDKRADDPMNLGCLLNDCKNLVIQLPKFERIIRIQVQMVQELENQDPNLPETQIEKDVLNQMQERKEKILKERAASLAAVSVTA